MLSGDGRRRAYALLDENDGVRPALCQEYGVESICRIGKCGDMPYALPRAYGELCVG